MPGGWQNTLKRRKPGFSESYYGFRSFGQLLEEAGAAGILELEREVLELGVHVEVV